MSKGMFFYVAAKRIKKTLIQSEFLSSCFSCLETKGDLVKVLKIGCLLICIVFETDGSRVMS